MQTTTWGVEMCRVVAPFRFRSADRQSEVPGDRAPSEREFVEGTVFRRSAGQRNTRVGS
jgi:hypothetical protein